MTGQRVDEIDLNQLLLCLLARDRNLNTYFDGNLTIDQLCVSGFKETERTSLLLM